MRPSTILYGASLLASALAEFKYSGKMTQNGVEVPVEFTELPSHNRTRSHARHSKRDGPVSTTNNWAGAIQEAPVSGVFQSITGQWQVPTISSPGPPLTSSPLYLYIWNGISSDCGTILQAGTANTLSSDGSSLFVWWEWFPSNAPQGVNVPINIGDWFQVTITASSTTAGTVTIENMTQGSTITIDVSGGDALCLDNVEWVVENPVSDTLPCPNFTEIWFAQCSATTTTGATMGITGTTAIHMASSDGTTIASEYVDNADFYVAF